MLKLYFIRYWKIASALLLLAVLLAAMLPAAWPRIDRIGWLDEADLVMHAVVFAFLTVWFTGLYPQRSYWHLTFSLMGQ